MKRFAAAALSLVLSLSLVAMLIPALGMTKASAEEVFTAPSEPTVADARDSAGGGTTDVKNLYANGNDVTIVEVDGKTLAKIEGYDDVDMSEGHWFVYAGGNTENAKYDEVTITMKGGAVDYIIGSNKAAGSVKTSNIIVEGGAVGMVIANRGRNGGGAPSYNDRKLYSVGTATITLSGGTFQAVAGTYGYSYTENVVMNISGDAYLNAQTSPTQTGVVLGGTNGEVVNATLNMTGGKTEGIALAQRTMITGKATINVTAGEAGNIYAGSFYNSTENSSNSWWAAGIGNVNYGKAAAIDIKIGKDVVYNDIFAGFQLYPAEMEAFEAAFGEKNPQHPAIVTDYSDAPITIELSSRPDADYTPAEADKDNTSLLRTVGVSNVTITDKTLVPEVPVVDPSEPVEDVTVGVTDDAAKDTLNEEVNNIINAVQKDGADAELSGVVSTDDTPVAEKIAEAIEAGKVITTVVVVEPVAEDKVAADEKTLISTAAGDATVAQYLNLTVQLKAGNDVIGTLTQLSKTVTYTVLIPEELINENTTFFVLRVHGDEVTKLPLTHVKDNQYSFTTDRFSTYALVYEVKEDENNNSSVPSTPSTPSESSEPSEPSEPSESSNPSDSTNPGSSEPEVPGTGDNGLPLWAVALAVLATGFIGFTVYQAQRRKAGSR